MIRPSGRKCLSCGKTMRALIATKGWATIEEAMDYCSLKCFRARPLPFGKIR